MAKLWLTRVLIPAALIIGVGLLITRRPAAMIPGDDEPSRERLHKIGLALAAATERLGRPPRDAEELRPLLREYGDPDRLLVSPVDGHPYVILWGADGRTAAFNTVLGYERNGSAGKRYVLTPTAVVQLTEAELAEADFPAGYPSPFRK
ncbi:MAG TPA: hypothetical protein VGF55_05400 [Gemmataceae bacterium]